MIALITGLVWTQGILDIIRGQCGLGEGGEETHLAADVIISDLEECTRASGIAKAVGMLARAPRR